MAEKKNFTIENYNGTDYDTLYPETNSGQVLLDSMAQTSTGLESGKTLDDALQIVGNLNDYDNRFEVGDVLTTSRSNLSDKWVLCNGDVMLSENYSKLADQFNAGLLNYKQNTASIASDMVRSRLACRERNGIKECLLTSSSSSSGSLAGRYSVIGSGAEWISIDVGNQYYIFARNNIFFRCGSSIIQWCADDPTNANSWNNMSVPDGVSGSPNDIFYKNGKYYMLMNDTFLIYNSLEATPQAINIETVTGRNLSSNYVGLDGDNFLFWTKTRSGTKTYWVDTFNPSGSLVGSNQISEEFKGVIYSFSNGYIKMYRTGTSNYTFHIDKVSTVTGTGTTIAQVEFPESTEMINFQHDFIVNNSYVVLPNNTYIDSEFNLHNATSSTGNVLLAICSSDDMVCVVSKLSNVGYKNTAVWDSPASSSFYLPVYSPADGLRAYIKAKD